jgi:predicted GNAT family acetyltransferase
VALNHCYLLSLRWKSHCETHLSACVQARKLVHALDRIVWESLTTYHAPLSEGTALARRFTRDVNLFASARDDSPAALAELSALVQPGEQVFIAQVPRVAIPPDLVEVKSALGVQMLATRAPNVDPKADITILTDADAPEMLALAKLTEPGPFLERTHRMGRFLGIRVDGRLAAMAGERMRIPGYTELSGVCTHPDFRGRGFARRLSAAVVSDIAARGDRAFLHAWKSNHTAIALYDQLGFQVRTDINISVLARP